MSTTTTLLAGKAESDRLRKVRRYVGDPARNIPGDLMALCREVLGYDALSDSFHGPMLRDWDLQDLRRFRCYEGLEPYGTEPLDNCEEWPRGCIKTWCQRARVIRYFLWNPAVTVTWWHAVEDKAIESGDAIAEQLQKNDKLRALFPPGVLPSKTKARFCSAGCFNLEGGRIGDADSFTALGAGGEGTGGHSLVGVLDDFVGYNDLVDSQMPRKKEFYRATVCNVVLRYVRDDGREVRGWKDCIETPWDPADPGADFAVSPDWKYRRRACLELPDGTPDEEHGEPVYLTREQIEKERREQKGLFPYQMMCDRSPRGEKPWHPASCEHDISLAEAMSGPGTVFVLSDPAPAKEGGFKGLGEKQRGDGTKDDWAWAAVRLRKNKLRQEIILLTGARSKEWTRDEGLDVGCRLLRRWRTPLLANEAYGGVSSDWTKDIAHAGRRNGVPIEQVKFKGGYEAGAKNSRFTALASRAQRTEFLICRETCDAEFLSLFLDQARDWRTLPGGKNGLRFDDCADVVSRATDAALEEYAPIGGFEDEDEVDDAPDWTPSRVRHIAAV